MLHNHVFIVGGAPIWRIDNFHKNARLKVGAALRDRCRSVAAILSDIGKPQTWKSSENVMEHCHEETNFPNPFSFGRSHFVS